MEEFSSRRAFIAAAGGGGVLALSASAQAQSRPADGDRISVDSFGAKGDGVSDDTKAIRAAIAAAEGQGGGIVTFGRKAYLVSDEITLDPTKTSLSGNRSILRLRRESKVRSLLRISATARSATYEQGTQFIEGVEFVGPGASTPTKAIVLSTPAEVKSSRIAIRNCVIHDFDTGVEHHDRCYLVQYYSTQIYNVMKGLAFTSRVDAGENTSLFGCSIFNSDVALFNESGSNLFSFGCSFDYCRQWFVGSGNVQFFGCWFEKHRPQTSTDYPFELSGSRFLISGGGIMTSGQDFDKGNACEFYFMLRSKLDQVTIERTSVWNLRTASGALAGGRGTIEVSGLTSVGRLFTPVITKDDDYHNLFGAAGSFDSGEIAFPFWLDSSGSKFESPLSLSWSADGRTYATARAVISEERPRSGKQCLKIEKGIGGGTPLTANFLARLSAGDALGMRFWWRSELPSGSDGKFWIQIFFVQATEGDDARAPKIIQRAFWGEVARQFSAGRTQWVQEAFNSYDVQEDAPSFCRAPAWATHALVTINLFEAPAGASLYLDDIGGFRM